MLRQLSSADSELPDSLAHAGREAVLERDRLDELGEPDDGLETGN